MNVNDRERLRHSSVLRFMKLLAGLAAIKNNFEVVGLSITRSARISPGFQNVTLEAKPMICPIPKGLHPKAQGWRFAYPGIEGIKMSNPNGGCAMVGPNNRRTAT